MPFKQVHNKERRPELGCRQVRINIWPNYCLSPGISGLDVHVLLTDSELLLKYNERVFLVIV